MIELITLQFSREDFDATKSLRLLEWCLTHGADEWTITERGVVGRIAPIFVSFEAEMALFRKPNAFREAMSALAGEDAVQLTELWELAGESITVLTRVFPKGIFEYQVTSDGWFEDLIIYRQGNLMLGIVSHEGYGILRVTPEEHDGLVHDGYFLSVV